MNFFVFRVNIVQRFKSMFRLFALAGFTLDSREFLQSIYVRAAQIPVMLEFSNRIVFLVMRQVVVRHRFIGATVAYVLGVIFANGSGLANRVFILAGSRIAGGSLHALFPFVEMTNRFARLLIEPGGKAGVESRGIFVQIVLNHLGAGFPFGER